MRRFELHRDEDATGISGTGVVVEGCQFSDGTCAYRWMAARRTTCVAESLDDIEHIHGHDGRTRIVILDG